MVERTGGDARRRADSEIGGEAAEGAEGRMSDLNLIPPGAPFIPEQPPTVVERQSWEWSDRAYLAEHAFDGQWPVLCTYERFGLELMERWLPADGVEGVP